VLGLEGSSVLPVKSNSRSGAEKAEK